MSDRTDLSVIVPTRNEAANVDRLIARLSLVLDARGAPEVVFVDDSDDDTPANILAADAPFAVRMIHRDPHCRRGGLGGAVLDGFRASAGRIIVVMDADLQHPPEVIPSLLSPIQAGRAQITIASRFAEGGQPAGLSGPARRVIAAGTRYLAARVVPNVASISDPMSGFFALARSVLRSGPTSSDGFKILLDVLAYGSWTSTVEVPYVFGDRVSGKSKATLSVGGAYLRQLWRIRRNLRSR